MTGQIPIPSVRKDMHVIVIHKNENLSAVEGSCLLRVAASSEPIAGIIFDGLRSSCWFDGNSGITIAVPEDWRGKSSARHREILYYERDFPVQLGAARKSRAAHRFVLSNGRFATSVDCQQLSKILANLDADLIAVDVEPALLSYREKVRITSGGNVAGFRRLYSDSVLPAPVPTDWPHHIFIKLGKLDRILNNGTLPLTFVEFVSRCTSNSLTWSCIRIGGDVVDLETESGLLSFLTTRLNSGDRCLRFTNGYYYDRTDHIPVHQETISAKARLFGRVVLGDNVHIGDNALVVGPTILSDNVKVAPAAVIRASVIGPGLSVPKGHFVQNRIFVGPESQRKLSLSPSKAGIRQPANKTLPSTRNETTNRNFRIWPRFSYARSVKRVADIVASLMVVILFAPIFPIIVIAIKLSSPGPVFFRDKRQGLQGKEFFCLKFRTMIVGADKIQEKLRFRNQVDGPQFKMQDDPRTTMVGRFLRDTFIDEVPQFLNILLGQMSVVGPRPSPESENSLCPHWHYARLSVRPGVTGLWQICRSRQPGRDFQEWIHYDIRYIRNLSMRLDLFICWQTVKILIANFIEQF